MSVVSPTKTITRADCEDWLSNGRAWSVPFGPSWVISVYEWRDTNSDWEGQYWGWWQTGKRTYVYGPLNVRG